MPAINTVAIRSEATECGYMIINESDYDPKKHTLYETPPQPDIDKPPLALEVQEVQPETEKKTRTKSSGS